MGQGLSRINETGETKTELEYFNKEELKAAFFQEVSAHFKSVELSSVASKLNLIQLRQKDSLTSNDIAELFEVEYDNNKESSVGHVMKVLYRSFLVIGNFPFLQDSAEERPLTIRDLIVSALFHTGRSQKIANFDFSEADYIKLLFISLSKSGQKQAQEAAKSAGGEVSEKLKDEGFAVEVIKSADAKDDAARASGINGKINWSTFPVITSFDDIQLDTLYIDSYDLYQVITFFLIVQSVQGGKSAIRKAYLAKGVENWKTFDPYSMNIARFIDINLTSKNVQSHHIVYEDFKAGLESGLLSFFQTSFAYLFERMLSSTNLGKNQAVSKSDLELQTSLVSTKLVNDATIAAISQVLRSISSNIHVSESNLIKLYSGSEYGFSIRSLESRIFKWQAPTIFILSGKRLKPNAIETNKRYQHFESEYPRVFKASENKNKFWQNNSDKVTFAIVVNEPWKISNKNNFGDNKTTIIRLSPYLDYFRSSSSQVLQAKSVYFNTVGMGIAFGNDQPLMKKSVQSYLPGDVSLTIDAALEFAVFRHLGSIPSKGSYFSKSYQHQIKDEDFEDRFMITELEVWGVGSEKELARQKRDLKIEEMQAEARRSVNLKSLGDDRAFLEMAGLVGNHNASGGSI
ncbi:Piso0_003222 [Millerozyma farinosa CBS 7064]|uniref:Piso0_003222 protein n=1 Tax=Pichia sorbitophila (strain ATCC MYA-4447 / BCRC 22081 / CBS 7064 / NBRC 10061 / NRRL Y-12695) TaxID=559304 RepID=G8YIH8_PICSO|nr:Piso0_003222 [Millerozyma farinosa CBS 7064]CCE80888.1 Piso0_003222 [Millerozyma farinosa CBS 7064]